MVHREGFRDFSGGMPAVCNFDDLAWNRRGLGMSSHGGPKKPRLCERLSSSVGLHRNRTSSGRQGQPWPLGFDVAAGHAALFKILLVIILGRVKRGGRD